MTRLATGTPTVRRADAKFTRLYSVGRRLYLAFGRPGHGDEITIGDSNYPCARYSNRVVRYDAIGATKLLDAILTLIPLDTFVPNPVFLMECPDSEPPIFSEYKAILQKHGYSNDKIITLERFKFYERSTNNSYAMIASGESAIYANIILKKGVIQ